MRLILLRHGQTSSNLSNLLDTAEPGPGLTDLGLAQAAAVPAALAGEDITAVYASSQTRAQLTAEPLAAARGLAVQVRRGLREISAGTLEMQNSREAIMGYLGVARQWLQGATDVRMPGADSGDEVLERFDAVVREVEESARGGTVVIVSHGAIIRTWSALRVENLDPAHPEIYELSNTGAVVLEGSMGTPRKEHGDGNGDGHRDTGGWTCLDWRSQAIGGAVLADPETDGPLADTGADGPGAGAPQADPEQARDATR
jgi:probable phosphoglycerate mutase